HGHRTEAAARECARQAAQQMPGKPSDLDSLPRARDALSALGWAENPSGDLKPSLPALPAPEDERWTAAWRPDATAQPQRIGGFPDIGAARRACEAHVGHSLAWFPVPDVPEVVTAAIDGGADYAVVDRVTQKQRGS
ncbi:MAG: hypothetical protein ACRDOE_11615, partial [Streptosporangiaceae bacterium]